MPFRDTKYLPHIHRGEKVYLLLRRHWLLPAIKALFWIFLIVIFLVLQGFLKDNFSLLAEGVGEEILNIAVSVFLIFSLLGLLIVWTMYYLNVQLVTNQRIIDINQKSIIHHETTGFDLRKVQDVTTEVRGPLANAFNYGNVFVQTAGTKQNFTFDHIPSPHRVAKTVLALSGKASGYVGKTLSSKKPQPPGIDKKP